MKLTEKELRKPDKFRVAMSNLIVAATENVTKIFLVIGVIILIFIGMFFMRHTSDKQQVTANFKFYEALKSYNEKDTADAMTKFLAVKEEFPKTDVSKIAVYYLGIISYDEGKYDEAAKYFNEYLDSGANDQSLKDAATVTLGLTSFEKGKWQEAIDQLSKVDKENSLYAKEARLHIALSLQKLGKYEEADKVLKEVQGQGRRQGLGF